MRKHFLCNHHSADCRGGGGGSRGSGGGGSGGTSGGGGSGTKKFSPPATDKYRNRGIVLEKSWMEELPGRVVKYIVIAATDSHGLTSCSAVQSGKENLPS